MKYGVKDCFDVANLKTGFGNPAWLATCAKRPALETAPAVAALSAAGAAFGGKTQMDELAFSLNGTLRQRAQQTSRRCLASWPIEGCRQCRTARRRELSLRHAHQRPGAALLRDVADSYFRHRRSTFAAAPSPPPSCVQYIIRTAVVRRPQGGSPEARRRAQRRQWRQACWTSPWGRTQARTGPSVSVFPADPPDPFRGPGGSVRVPASYCGIFGIRPSWGAISMEGERGLSRNPAPPTY